MFDPSQPPLISETLLKNRRSLEELAHRRSVTVKTQNKRKRLVKGENIKLKRPEQYTREFRIREGSQNKMNRRRKQIEQRSSSTVTKILSKDTVGLAVRIHIGRHASAEIKAALKGLNLTRKYDAVFVKLDEENIRKLKPLDAYVAYGYISKRSTVELVHRRAFTTAAGAKQPLSDNVVVERLLGDRGIICLNDLSEEIHSVGPNFKAATDILAPFRLSAPLGHYEEKVLKEHDEVETMGGFLGEEMEVFLNKIL